MPELFSNQVSHEVELSLLDPLLRSKNFMHLCDGINQIQLLG